MINNCNKTDEHDLIVKYVFGETNTDETSEAVNLLYTEPELKTYYYRLMKLYETPDLSGRRKHTAYKVQNTQKIDEEAKSDNSIFFMRPRVGWAVASVVVFAVAVFFAVKLFDFEPSVYSYETGDACRDEVLPDGSKAFMNKDCVLKYVDDGGERRTVIFEKGEVLFDVKRNEALPFDVITPSCVVTVLGTSFNIREIEKDSILVSVVSGKVNVQPLNSKGKSFYLLKGDQMVVGKNKSDVTVEEMDNENVIAWKTGLLEFDEEKMENVLTTLTKTYGVTVEVQDPDFYDCHLTAKFKNQTVDAIFEIIEMSFGADIESIDGKFVVKDCDVCE